MEVKNLQNQKGFTLVEIAIVLVIIGLLLGGVLKGQELITNAKVKSVTQDLEGYSAAYYAFQDRVGRLPGASQGSSTITPAVTLTDLADQGFTSPAASHALDGDFFFLDRTNTSNPFAPTNNAVCTDNVLGEYATGMDAKLDDGIASTGQVQSFGGAATASYPTGTATSLCRQL
jgi:prepilin-type N-terminal cleavage/methylation domain-containing protein